MIQSFTTFAITAAIAGLLVSPCRADISSVTASGSAVGNLVFLGPVCFPAYSCGPYDAQVVSDTISGGSSQLSFAWAFPTATSPTSQEDRLILEVINGSGLTLNVATFTLGGGPAMSPTTFDYPATNPVLGNYSAGTFSSTSSTVFGSVDGSQTVWTAPLALAPGQEADFYAVINYQSAPFTNIFTLDQQATFAPEPGLYVVLALGLTGLVVVIRRRNTVARRRV